MKISNNLEEQKDIYGNSNDQVASVFGFIRELAKIKNKKIFHIKDIDKKIWINKIKEDQLPGIRFGDGHQKWVMQIANLPIPDYPLPPKEIAAWLSEPNYNDPDWDPNTAIIPFKKKSLQIFYFQVTKLIKLNLSQFSLKMMSIE